MSLGMDGTGWVSGYDSARYGAFAQPGLNTVHCCTGSRTKARPAVSIIGDSRALPGSPNYELAYWLGYTLVSAGYRIVVCGNSGIKEAAARGACFAGSYSDADVISVLPGDHPRTTAHFYRACSILSEDLAGDVAITDSDAVVAIGGGPCTLTQIAHAWALDKLIIAYRVKGWSGRVADRPLDARERLPDVPDDRVYGASSENEVLEKLGLLAKYQ